MKILYFFVVTCSILNVQNSSEIRYRIPESGVEYVTMPNDTLPRRTVATLICDPYDLSQAKLFICDNTGNWSSFFGQNLTCEKGNQMNMKHSIIM